MITTVEILSCDKIGSLRSQAADLEEKWYDYSKRNGISPPKPIRFALSSRTTQINIEDPKGSYMVLLKSESKYFSDIICVDILDPSLGRGDWVNFARLLGQSVEKKAMDSSKIKQQLL